MAGVIRIISDSEMSYMYVLRLAELAGVLEHLSIWAIIVIRMIFLGLK